MARLRRRSILFCSPFSRSMAEPHRRWHTQRRCAARHLRIPGHWHLGLSAVHRMQTQVPSLTGTEDRPDDVRLDINLPGEKELPGFWIDQTEGGEVLAEGDDRARESRSAGHLHRLPECGLKGFPEAIETIYPKAAVQLAAHHAVLRLPAGDQETDLHEQRP